MILQRSAHFDNTVLCVALSSVYFAPIVIITLDLVMQDNNFIKEKSF